MLGTIPVVLTFEGVSNDTPTRLHDRFKKIYDEPLIIMDLRGVGQIDVAFLAELALLRMHRRTHGLMLGRLVINSEKVLESLCSVGFQRNWPVFATQQEAIASFDGPPIFA